MKRKDIDPSNPMPSLTGRLKQMSPGDVIYIETRDRDESTEVARGVTARKNLHADLHDRSFTTSLAVAVFHAGAVQHIVRIACF